MRILFSGGGTIGPVTPLLAVANVIRERHPAAELSWIGTVNGPERELVKKYGLSFFAISSGKFRRYFSFSNVVDAFRILAGVFQSYLLLGKIRPDIVVSAGGFVAVPVIWAAWLRGIPSHVHQQDIRPGLANRLSAPFARSITVAFEKSLSDFPKEKTAWTGNPIRAEVFSGSKAAAATRFGLEQGIPTVLALGGGTGSVTLNELIRGAAREICKEAQIIHVAGAGKTTESIPLNRYRQEAFLTAEMGDALAAADLVVTRAGMGALTELAALGKPALIMPMAGTHQEENARFFADAGAAILLDERTASPESFVAAVVALLRDPATLAKMSQAMRGFARPHAAELVADAVTKGL